MKRFEESTTVEASPSAVYAYVSDFGRHGEWSGHGLEITQDGDGPVGVGTTFSTVAKQFGTQKEQSTITEMTPDSAFAWDSTGALGRVHHWFGLTADGGSTKVTKGAEMVQPTFLAKAMSWRLSKDIQRSLASDLQKIKAKLESGSGSG
jgi:uncharacterized membrane protein